MTELRNPGFSVINNPDRQAEISKNFSELRRMVTAGRENEYVYKRAQNHITSAPFKERRFIDPIILIDDLKQQAHDKDTKSIRLSQVERLAEAGFVDKQDFTELSSTGLAVILDQHKDNIKKLRSIRRR